MLKCKTASDPTSDQIDQLIEKLKNWYQKKKNLSTAVTSISFPGVDSGFHPQGSILIF